MTTEEKLVFDLNASGDAESKKNTKVIRCQICGSKVLSKGSCTYIDTTFALPYMKAKDKDGKSLNNKTEEVNQFWLVLGMMTFENVGFTRTVDGLKYLICADCEVGPIGYQDVKESEKHYVAVDRVQYKES